MLNNIRYAKINSWAKAPTRKFSKDAGLDLYYCADSLMIGDNVALTALIIPPHMFDRVHTGVAVEIPEGYVGILKAKSKSNFVVGAGVIDSGYQGEIVVKIFNTTENHVVFSDGDPVAQLLIIPVETPTVDEVSYSELTKNETERGSTGGIHSFESEISWVDSTGEDPSSYPDFMDDEVSDENTDF